MTTISSARLMLRPLHAGDADALVRGLSNLEVSRWTARIPHPYRQSDAEDFLTLCREDAAGIVRLAITRDAELIGVISVEHGEIGYWIAEPHWARGYGAEAARAITDHAFETMGLDEMTARFAIGNAASRRILLGLGFIEMGEAKSFSRATASETAVMCLTLTRESWQGARERRR